MSERNGGEAASRGEEPGREAEDAQRPPGADAGGPADHSEAAEEGIARATAAVGDDGQDRA